jgi:hypothetical protein
MDRDPAETSRAYLLGQLDERETEQVEARYFSDAAFFDEVDAAADRLCDDYVRGGLAADEAASVRELAQQPDWRRRVSLAEALRLELAAQPEAASRPNEDARVWFSIGAWFRCQSIGLRFGLAAATLIVALGWPLLVVQMLRSQAELASLRSDLEPQVATAQARVVAAESETASLQSRVAALEKVFSALRTVSLVLMPGMSRGEGDTLVVPGDASFVRLRLALERVPEKGTTYRVVLRTVDRAVVWSQDGIGLSDGPDRTPLVTVPAIALQTGQYELLLLTPNRSGQFEEIETFSFRMTRR